MPSNSREELMPLALEYAESRNITITLEPQIGWGTDGYVWHTSRTSVIKVHERLSNCEDELECYHRLQDAGMTELRGLALPWLMGHELRLRAIEVTIVQPPCLIDFGKVYLDREPPYWRDEQIMADWERQRSELFEGRWPDVKKILGELQGLGIYYVDPSPANIMFGEA